MPWISEYSGVCYGIIADQYRLVKLYEKHLPAAITNSENETESTKDDEYPDTGRDPMGDA